MYSWVLYLYSLSLDVILFSLLPPLLSVLVRGQNRILSGGQNIFSWPSGVILPPSKFFSAPSNIIFYPPLNKSWTRLWQRYSIFNFSGAYTEKYNYLSLFVLIYCAIRLIRLEIRLPHIRISKLYYPYFTLNPNKKLYKNSLYYRKLHIKYLA